VPQHRFSVGQSVTFSDSRFPHLISGVECVVVRLLPTRYNGPEYQIRCPRLASDVIFGERELTAVEPAQAIRGRAAQRMAG
jgi:hypothetical protein